MKRSITTYYRTAEMPLWTGEEDAPEPISPDWSLQQFTVLPPYVPFWAKHSTSLPVPYARRVEHEARHTPRPVRGQLKKWAANVWREAGEFMVGAFQPIRDAI